MAETLRISPVSDRQRGCEQDRRSVRIVCEQIRKTRLNQSRRVRDEFQECQQIHVGQSVRENSGPRYRGPNPCLPAKTLGKTQLPRLRSPETATLAEIRGIGPKKAARICELVG